MHRKWVRVMADYASDGLWDMDGLCASAEELPISELLQARLAAWCAWHDRDCEDYLPVDKRTSEFPVAEFTSEGLAIARAIKAELPDWTVVYLDESRLRLGDRTQLLEEFEYEVEAL